MAEFRTRRFVPTPPAERPRRSREAVRVVVSDGDFVLMLRDSDPGIPGSAWYVTPGGGLDPGETLLEAAVREVREETGLEVSAAELVGPLMTRVVVHGYSDQILSQAETFFVLWTTRFEPDIAGHTEAERLTVTEVAWLPVASLAEESIPVWPEVLPELLALAAAPTGTLVDLGLVEESTVPVDAG